MGKSVYDTYESSGKGPIVQVLEQPKIESGVWNNPRSNLIFKLFGRCDCGTAYAMLLQ
jgi:hypothetical protein